MRRTLAPIASAAVLGLALAGCGGGTPADDQPTAAEVSTTVAASPSTTAAPTPAPAEESAERVAPEPTSAEPIVETPAADELVAATVLIVGGGDLEAAILDGSISEAAAEAALAAIENGTLAELLVAD